MVDRDLEGDSGAGGSVGAGEPGLGHRRIHGDLVATARRPSHDGAIRHTPVEADHGRIKARLRPMRGLKRQHSARTPTVSHAFVQNLRRGHYDIATEHLANERLAATFSELALCLRGRPNVRPSTPTRHERTLNATAAPRHVYGSTATG